MIRNFPREDELWKRHVEQLLLSLGVDRDRLMKTTPQIPDPEAGNAFMGPLVPVPFEFHGGGGPAGSGSARLSGPGGSGNTGGLSGS